ncbi:MAG TPA: POTRA domain-containing protein, partial [Bacteroidales bacterium]|nr:POTRA domain-containing protein [Bacteroidales bacterium]
RLIRSHFVDKGFFNAQVEVTQKLDTTAGNMVTLDFKINRGKKMKISEIAVTGNNLVEEKVIRKSMKETKEKKIYHLFKASKYIPSEFEKDKSAVIAKYKEMGYRDVSIVSDTVAIQNEKELMLGLKIDEGPKYYFGEITWVGNSKYTDKQLNEILGLKRGDVYNQSMLESSLFYNLSGRDISSLYMDDGYLFFSVTPVEKSVIGDTINLEIQIYEGKQATINKVTLVGNTRTNDHVILREIRTKPGQLFNRSDIIRTQRELAQLRYFNNEKLAVNPKPNPADGTVDIEYVVEETSTDQFELSGGWGLGRLVGTLGVSFNNFSIRNIFNGDSYRPLPTGDGQKLSIRGQSNGTHYQSYNMSFTEPWLGGKKPNALSFSLFHSVQTNGVSKADDGTYSTSGKLLERQVMNISGASIGLGKRLKWPDDYFMEYLTLSYQFYNFDEYFQTYSFTSGNANNVNFGIALSRSSSYDPIFPKSGSEISASVTFTPPYSYFNDKDYSTATDQDKFKWLEYHKWKFNATLYTKLFGDLVLMSRTKFGFLGMWNKEVGLSPFERFYLGGDGLSGFALDGREIIGMRGYYNSVLTPRDGSNQSIGGTIYSKYTMELRYPISTNPMATIYLLSFVEAGNTWLKFTEFDPFAVKRSAGLGVRIYLPMFGLLGLDYGIPFDDVPGYPAWKGQFHFSINSSID